MVEDEFNNPSVTEIQKHLADEDYRCECLHRVCPFHMSTKTSDDLKDDLSTNGCSFVCFMIHDIRCCD